ncbi:hypothetical protein BB558_002008 [Smittium angustum]|uniref:A-kinase anchor protein 7-like phosphoesterase domain-containing protein n=1 Tax=Smittium angustum TaxID=133377 RepID=A0A2U1J9T4_SMIAN|nr:hypothetical protein BB558_002008 [Smittium angustum]
MLDIIQNLLLYKDKSSTTFEETLEILPYRYQNYTFWYFPPQVDHSVRKYFPSFQGFFLVEGNSKCNSINLNQQTVLEIGEISSEYYETPCGNTLYKDIKPKQYSFQTTNPTPLEKNLANNICSQYSIHFSSSTFEQSKTLDPLVVCRKTSHGTYEQTINQQSLPNIDYIITLPNTSQNIMQLIHINHLGIYENLELSGQSSIDTHFQEIANSSCGIIQDYLISSPLGSFLDNSELKNHENQTSVKSKKTIKNQPVQNKKFESIISASFLGKTKNVVPLNLIQFPNEVYNHDMNKNPISYDFLTIKVMFDSNNDSFLTRKKEFISFNKELIVLQTMINCWNLSDNSQKYKNPNFISKNKVNLTDLDGKEKNSQVEAESDSKNWIAYYNKKIDTFLKEYCHEYGDAKNLEETDDNEYDKESNMFSEDMDFSDKLWLLASEARDQDDLLDLLLALSESFSQNEYPFEPTLRKDNTSIIANLLKLGDKNGVDSGSIKNNKVVENINDWVDNEIYYCFISSGIAKLVNDLDNFFRKIVNETYLTKSSTKTDVNFGIKKRRKQTLQLLKLFDCCSDPEEEFEKLMKLYDLAKLVMFFIANFLQVDETTDFSFENDIMENMEDTTEISQMVSHLIEKIIDLCIGHHFSKSKINSLESDNSSFEQSKNYKQNQIIDKKKLLSLKTDQLYTISIHLSASSAMFPRLCKTIQEISVLEKIRISFPLSTINIGESQNVIKNTGIKNLVISPQDDFCFGENGDIMDVFKTLENEETNDILYKKFRLRTDSISTTPLLETSENRSRNKTTRNPRRLETTKRTIELVHEVVEEKIYINSNLITKTINLPSKTISLLSETFSKEIVEIKELSKVEILFDLEKEIIEIFGNDNETTDLISEQILDMAAKVAYKVPYTHFISIPLRTESFKRQINEFQNQLIENSLKDSSSTKIKTNHMIKPTKLHLTLGMLSLTNERQVSLAVELLIKLEQQVLNLVRESQKSFTESDKVKRMYIEFGNLKTFGNPKYSSVLYTEPLPSTKNNKAGLSNQQMSQVFELIDGNYDALVKVSDFLRSEFIKGGILFPGRQRGREERFTLHATIANTKEGGYKNGGRNGDNVNLGEILKSYQSCNFGLCLVDEIQIAKRFRYNEDGSYYSEGGIKF